MHRFLGFLGRKFKIPVINVINIWKLEILEPAVAPTDFSLPEKESFLLCIMVIRVGK